MPNKHILCGTTIWWPQFDNPPKTQPLAQFEVINKSKGPVQIEHISSLP